jgi:hypothetical protein
MAQSEYEFKLIKRIWSQMEPLFNNSNSDEQINSANISFSDEVKDYSNDPTFIKRAQEAKEFMEKVGFSEELLKIRDDMYGPDEEEYDLPARPGPKP